MRQTSQIKITAAESQIMDVLWAADGPVAAEEVRERLNEGWSEATVRTFLSRLVKKKALAQTKDGRRFLYRPLIARQAYAQAESESLIDRLFGGQVVPFITQFASAKTLTDEEVAQLRKLVEKLENDR